LETELLSALREVRTRQFQRYRIWQESRDLVREVCRVGAKFLSWEAYGLQSQVRRAATSIPANIA